MLKRNLYRVINVICVLLLAAATLFVLMRWQQLPEQIPTHYNFAGEVDGYGGKGSLILLIVMSWIVFFIMTISIRFPEKWNMPVEVTEENRSRLFAIARAMMEIVKFFVTLLFVILFVSMAASATVSQWVIIVMTAAVLLTVIVGIAMMYKCK